MSSDRSLTSRIFVTSVIESKVDLDEKFDRSYNNVLSLTRGTSEKEAHDALNKALDEKKVHDEVCLGLLVGILSDPPNASRHYNDLIFVSRDNLKVITETLTQPAFFERYSRLLEVARRQLLWLTRELVKSNVTNAEAIVWCLLRQIAGGDVSSKNVWLAESLLDILQENRAWLYKFPVIVASVIYTYLRVLEDHFGPQFANLRQKEVNFVVSLLRERFADCLMIGRDIIRLLQNVARIPEIEAFWYDLLHNPSSLAPNFTGVLEILHTRTSRRFFMIRLTPDMENKIIFLCSHVKFGMQKRYQEWFQKQYLNTPESQTLRCDLIRFIIGYIHPPNEVLCSDIIQRWTVIGWLLSTCTSPVATANCKMALFYDWLFYKDTESIMNIEPAILVMYHSMRSHPALTTSLLDFLCRIIPNFYHSLSDKVRLGVTTSLRQILEKRVVQSLKPLFDNPRMDMEVRKLVRESFPEFCSLSPDLKPEDFVPPVSASMTKMDLMMETGLDMCHPSANSDDVNSNHVSSEDDAKFSDEDDDTVNSVNSVSVPQVPVSRVHTDGDTCGESEAMKPRRTSWDETLGDKFDIEKDMEYLEKDMKEYLLELKKEENSQNRCDILQKFCDLIFGEGLEQDEALHLASCLCHILRQDFIRTSPKSSLLPENVNMETVEESLGQPHFVLFSNLLDLAEDNHRRESLLLLLVEMRAIVPQLGYHFLYFLKASLYLKGNEIQDSRRSALYMYKDFCKASGQKDFAGFIVNDIRLCCEEDPRLISWIIPSLYESFPKQTTGNAELLQVILERLDSAQLHDLVCMVLQGALHMFDNNSFSCILEKSISWETIEQIFLWQLARAHEIPVDCCLSVLPKLHFSSHTSNVSSTHGEALSNILMMLRRESPSETLLKHLLQREFKVEDPTVVTILQYWVQRYEDKMAKLLNDLVNNKQAPSPNKRKRSQNIKYGAVPLNQVLSHLDHLRHACDQTKFFALETMQETLVTAQGHCTEAQKKKYGDLFALIEEEREEEREPQKQKTKSNRGRKPKARKKPESESEESSEEEDLKKPPRKRKKNNQLASDSD